MAISNNFRKYFRNKYISLLLKIFIGIESVIIFLWVLNFIFHGPIVIVRYHGRMWDLMLEADTFQVMISVSIPILLTAMGATFNERAGVINIGLEGTMIWGAWAAIYFTDISGNPWIGILGAITFGLIVSLLHAIFTITFKSEQIVTGVAVNLLALGMTEVLTQLHWGQSLSDGVERFDKIDLFEKLSIEKYRENSLFFPIQVLNNHNILVWLGLLLIPICHIVLFHTTFGLRMRVIGEHPQAAATAGISVQRYQYFAVLISGALTGLGGAVLAMDAFEPRFDASMVGGRGFTALAAMIFGKWTIFGSALASLFFGYFVSLQISLQVFTIPGIAVPSPILQMFPPIIAIMALAGFIGRARPPKAIGKPYNPTEEG